MYTITKRVVGEMNKPNNKVLFGGSFASIKQEIIAKYYPYLLESLAKICPSLGGGVWRGHGGLI